MTKYIPILWIGVRNGRKAVQIAWLHVEANWYEAGPLACHNYRRHEWRLLLDGKPLGRAYETPNAAMRTAQRFKAVRERLEVQ